MAVLLVTRDLAVISQVDGAAARAGTVARSVSTEADAMVRLAEEAVRLVIVDLGLPSLDVGSLVGQLQSAAATRPRIVAFGPHVHGEKLAAARDAGCDSVISRGQFFAQLDAVLAGA